MSNDVLNVFDEVGGKVTFEAIAELGEYQKEMDLPFSYRTREELLDMLSQFCEFKVDGDEEKYPNLEIIREKLNEYERKGTSRDQ